MLNEFEFKKNGENDKLVNLHNSQKKRVEEFNNWLIDSINKKKIKLFYRGVDEEHLKNRVKKSFRKGGDNGKMRYLFEYGEKAKSYLKENVKKQADTNHFLSLIQDVTNEAFSKIFYKVREVLTMKRKDVVKNFKCSNPAFNDYFYNKANHQDFLTKTQRLNNFEKFNVRNYYLRLLHTIGEIGDYNELSLCVSLSTELEVAKDFAGQKGIVLFYWLPNPIHRFGTSIEIIHQSSSFIGEKGLPIYFSDFFPKQKEFCLTGALLPHQLIGYQKNENFVFNPHLINSNQVFNEDFVEEGLVINQEKFEESIIRNSEYGKFLKVTGNFLYQDIKIEN
jgi:hypothetical protein